MSRGSFNNPQIRTARGNRVTGTKRKRTKPKNVHKGVRVIVGLAVLLITLMVGSRLTSEQKGQVLERGVAQITETEGNFFHKDELNTECFQLTRGIDFHLVFECPGFSLVHWHVEVHCAKNMPGRPGRYQKEFNLHISDRTEDGCYYFFESTTENNSCVKVCNYADLQNFYSTIGASLGGAPAVARQLNLK